MPYLGSPGISTLPSLVCDSTIARFPVLVGSWHSFYTTAPSKALPNLANAPTPSAQVLEGPQPYPSQLSLASVSWALAQNSKHISHAAPHQIPQERWGCCNAWQRRSTLGRPSNPVSRRSSCQPAQVLQTAGLFLISPVSPQSSASLVRFIAVQSLPPPPPPPPRPIHPPSRLCSLFL